MTGAKAAMDRVFVARERHTVDTDQAEVLATLAQQVRELNHAVIHTDLPAAELAEVTGLLAGLTDRLNAQARDRPPVAAVGANGMIRQLASPVSGRLNPIAPPIQITALPGGVTRTVFTLGDLYEGPPTFVHGGVSALVLDELLGNAAAANGTPGMTATLDLRYRRPTPLGVPLTAEARTDRVDGRKTFVNAWIKNPEGQITIEASAMFIMPRR
ncbi:MAG: PaaI family thioesterase [Streptosporangiaceae bacterium]